MLTESEYCFVANKINSDKDPIYSLERVVKEFYYSGRKNILLLLLMRYSSENLKRHDAVFNNRLLNTVEILQGKTVLESKPLHLEVTITSRCNIKCIMCDLANNNDWDMAENIFNEVVELFPYLRDIAWIGGEVFLSKYFEKALEKSHAYPYMRQRVQTNGLLLNKRWIEKILNNRVSLDLSIDSFTKKTYEYIRCGAKFENLIENLELFKKCRSNNDNKIEVSLTFTIMKSNYKELENIVDFAKQYNIDSIILNNFRLWGSSTKEAFELEKIDDNVEILDYIHNMIPVLSNKAFSCGVKVYDTLHKIEKYEHGRRCDVADTGFLFCHMPWQKLMCGFKGYVSSHCFCKKQLGDYTRNSLEQIWNSKEMQLNRFKLLKSDYRNICNEACLSGKINNLGIVW